MSIEEHDLYVNRISHQQFIAVYSGLVKIKKDYLFGGFFANCWISAILLIEWES